MTEVPDPRVPERARRRTYTAKYKRDILAEYDSLDWQGRGALLRRKALYTSLVSAWREHASTGALAALARPSGAPPASQAERDAARFRIENARLERELETARQVISSQGKLSALLELLSTNSSIPDTEK
jgi:transposase